MQYLRRFWHHPWTTAACNVALVMFFYSLMRLFLYFFFPHLFLGTETSHFIEMFLGGLRFDLTAVLYLSSAYLLLVLLPLPEHVRNNSAYQIIEKSLFYIPNALGIIINCMDMPYISFTSRRTTFSVFKEFANDDNIKSIILEGMGDYWFVTIFGVAMLIALWAWYRRPLLPISLNLSKYYIC